MMPFNLTVFFSAMLIVNVYERLTPRQIGRFGFALCTVALAAQQAGAGHFLAGLRKTKGHYAAAADGD